jgi:hypothetical protein
MELLNVRNEKDAFIAALNTELMRRGVDDAESGFAIAKNFNLKRIRDEKRQHFFIWPSRPEFREIVLVRDESYKQRFFNPASEAYRTELRWFALEARLEEKFRRYVDHEISIRWGRDKKLLKQSKESEVNIIEEATS